MKCVFCGNTKVLFRTTVKPFFTVCLRCAIEQHITKLRKVGEHSVKEQLEERGSQEIQLPLPLVWNEGDKEEPSSSTPHKE
jgi:hypothetical protein